MSRIPERLTIGRFTCVHVPISNGLLFEIYAQGHRPDLGRLNQQQIAAIQLVRGVEAVCSYAHQLPHLSVRIATNRCRNPSVPAVLARVVKALDRLFPRPPLTPKSPLHKKALTLKQLERGMQIRVCGRAHITGMVTGIKVFGGKPKVRVMGSILATDHWDAGGRWYFAQEMGLVPYQAGTPDAYWDPDNHTLEDN